MVRGGFALAALLAGIAGCHDLACGPGTKQVQWANGDVQCVVADNPATGHVPCDVDGGNAEIVDGVCVSHVVCDPGSASYDPISGLCTGSGMAASVCPVCPATPGAGQTCITGRVIDFATGAPLAAGTRSVRIGAYDPLSFLSDPAGATPIDSTTDDKGCFTFTIPTPASGIVALGVDDPSAAVPKLALGASGAPILSNTSYKVDAYLVLQSLVDGYAQVSAAYASGGTYVGCFYADPPPNPLTITFSEKLPVMGVKLVQNGVVPSPVNYLKPDRTIDAALTATGELGCAITTGSGHIDQFSGMGGAFARWETQLGGTAAPAVFVSRFHGCDGTTGDPFCQ
jgi:hypothetical protein